MKKTKLEKELTAHFTNFFAGVITSDIKIVCRPHEIAFQRQYRFPGTTCVHEPFRISFVQNIPSTPAMSYSNPHLSLFCANPDQKWDIIKKDFETFEKLYQIIKTSNKQILNDANKIAQAHHDELVLFQLQNGWDKRSYRVAGSKPIILAPGAIY